jgi:hypothetical protein
MTQVERELPEWMQRTAAANAPFNEENTPLLRLWNGFVNKTPAFETLVATMQQVHKRMVLLDKAPRHDTILSDEVLREVAYDSYHYPMGAARNRLEHSLATIDEAFDKIQHVFRGELKVAYYERLARHRAEARNLVELFSELPDERAVQPFTIRQRNMANLYHELNDFVGIITPLRRRFEPGELPADVYADLKEVEAEIYRLRSSFARWRDNPSQKLGRKMADAHARCLKIALTVSRIAHNARYACQQLGMSFWGRGGPIIIEPWTPPTHLS